MRDTELLSSRLLYPPSGGRMLGEGSAGTWLCPTVPRPSPPEAQVHGQEAEGREGLGWPWREGGAVPSFLSPLPLP